MKVRLGTLRLFISEVIAEQAWVPGRWDPRHGEPVDDEELAAMGEVDDRMVGDGTDDIADHLRSDEEGRSLGNAPDETMREAEELARELRRYFLQEATPEQDSDAEGADGTSEPPGSEGEDSGDGGDPTGPAGFYTPFDMTKDHMGTDDLSSTWYRSPGRPMGTEGDPFRSEDPHAQLGFHPPGGSKEGEPLAPQIWQLTAGSDTSKVLGANAKPDSGGVDSGDGSKESEAPGSGEDDSEEAEGEKPGAGGPGSRKN